MPNMPRLCTVKSKAELCKLNFATRKVRLLFLGRPKFKLTDFENKNQFVSTRLSAIFPPQCFGEMAAMSFALRAASVEIVCVAHREGLPSK
jgi:hypothetical protein